MPQLKPLCLFPSLEIPSGFPLVHMDRARIAQVVGNLLDNAILHTSGAGRERSSRRWWRGPAGLPVGIGGLLAIPSSWQVVLSHKLPGKHHAALQW